MSIPASDPNRNLIPTTKVIENIGRYLRCSLSSRPRQQQSGTDAARPAVGSSPSLSGGGGDVERNDKKRILGYLIGHGTISHIYA